MSHFADYFHILNPNLGHRRQVRRLFRDEPMDHHCWVERRTHPTHLETLVEWAVREGKAKVAVWGGDGTFSRVAQELYRLQALDKVALALVPVGTANDFARKLAYRSWKSVVGSLREGGLRVRNFDLGLVQTAGRKRVFVNNSGFGRKQEAIKRTRSNSFKDIFGFEEHKLQVEWMTGHVTQYETIRAILGIVFNGPFFNNGMYFCKAVSPDDGVLNGFFAPPQGQAGMIKKFLAGRLGGGLMDDKTFRMDAEEIRIESDKLMFPQADGEPIVKDSVREIQYTLLKGALHLEWTAIDLPGGEGAAQ